MTKTLRNKIGTRICVARHDSLLTQEELARKAHISRGFLSDIERGKRAIAVETLARLCRALKLNPTEVLA